MNSPPRSRFFRRFWVSLGLALATPLAPGTSGAVTQPGNVTVPVLDDSVTTCEDKNVQRCLDESEEGTGRVDAQADARTAPETFQPTCRLTFKPIVKGGENSAGFGWYNVKPDPQNPGKFLQPTQEELFGMLLLNTRQQTGAQLAGQAATLDLAEERAAGRYQGGQIGFFLASGSYTFDAETRALSGFIERLFFSQHELNPGSDAAQPFFQVLTWQSVAQPQAFYFGWEDQAASSDSDNDFDDLVFLVSGIQCAGSGQPCETGQLGACGLGTVQCQKGVNACVPNATAQPESCNAVDDDCDGSIDDGDLCEGGKVCDHGRCVPKCGTAEFRCASGDVCNPRGLCVEAACVNKDCPPGQLCAAGACVDACAGVMCPHGQLCRGGSCLDPCQGLTCDEGYACVAGVCQSCACSGCGAGELCSKNVCIEQACDQKTCAAGSHCRAGACVDDCAGSVCPQGQLCSAGRCQPGMSSNGGSMPTDSMDPVVIVPDSGGTGGAKAGAAGAPPGAAPADAPKSGCGCSVAGNGWSGTPLAMLGLLAVGRRRQRLRNGARAARGTCVQPHGRAQPRLSGRDRPGSRPRH